MGISTLQSYRGAQVFEAIGLNKELVDRYFTGTASRIDGVGLDVLAEEAIRKHRHAFAPLQPIPEPSSPIGGNYQFRAERRIPPLQPATPSPNCSTPSSANSFETFEEYTALIDSQNRQLCTLRGLFEIKNAEEPIPLEEVEPASEIVKRFATGAMSFGSISKEAHETLAIAMNRIGGKSNTGEGGEDEGALPRQRAAAPSSRSPPAASASPPIISSMPTSCRSKWRRAPSPAKAASFPATKSMTPSRACATPSPASA